MCTQKSNVYISSLLEILKHSFQDFKKVENVLLKLGRTGVDSLFSTQFLKKVVVHTKSKKKPMHIYKFPVAYLSTVLIQIPTSKERYGRGKCKGKTTRNNNM